MDKRVFVFCIGGTGLRVMKSITMLMAAGMKTNGYTVIPIVIDPHKSLDEQKNLNSLLSDYINIYNNTISDGKQSLNPLEGFFNSAMADFKSITNRQNDTNVTPPDQRSFGTFIDESKIQDNDVNRLLLQTLFSQKNLDNKLSVGFKGNPNVGTVVLGDMISGSDDFKRFLDNCQGEDRIFIISSIFGGTGASGYPLINEKIQNADDYPSVKNALRGAVTVLPYYQLSDPGVTNSDIESANFLTKAKSALAYYENHVISDYLYYVGEKNMTQTYANNEEEQKDTAHFVELVAATAFFDFLGREKQDTPQYYTRAIKEDVLSMDLNSLGPDYKPLVKNVADFTLLDVLINILPSEGHFPLEKTQGMNSSFYESSSFASLKAFSEMFNKWYEELANNSRAFSPLNNDRPRNNMSEWVKHASLAPNDSYYLLEMIKAANNEKSEHNGNVMRHFLKYAYEAINHYTVNI